MLLGLFYTFAAIYGISYAAIGWFFIYHWVKGIPIFEDYPDEDGEYRVTAKYKDDGGVTAKHYKINYD